MQESNRATNDESIELYICSRYKLNCAQGKKIVQPFSGLTK